MSRPLRGIRIGEESVSDENRRDMNLEAAERLEYRRSEEAKRSVEILKRVKSLGKRLNDTSHLNTNHRPMAHHVERQRDSLDQ